MKHNFLLIISSILFLIHAQSCQKLTTANEQTRFEKKATIAPPVTYSGEYLTGIDFPIGAVGGSLIRMNGKAERRWWQIFNNFEERAGSGIVPNSFFALRTKTKNTTVVRALQTSSANEVEINLLATQQNAVGFSGYDTIAGPNQKTASNITVKLAGAELAIKNSKQDGNTITIQLELASQVKAGSRLAVSFNLDE